MPLVAQGAVAHAGGNEGYCTSSTDHGNITSTCASTVKTATFTYTPVAANNAVLFVVHCSCASAPTVTLTATGWTITALSSPTGTTDNYSASFGAIAPSTSAATFTMTWSVAINTFEGDMIDEFSGNNTAGGTTTFDSHNAGEGTTSNASITTTPANNNDGLWGAAYGDVSAVGSGFTAGQNDTDADLSEYKILSGGSGVAQTVNFTSAGTWSEVAATVAPAPCASMKIGGLDTQHTGCT